MRSGLPRSLGRATLRAAAAWLALSIAVRNTAPAQDTAWVATELLVSYPTSITTEGRAIRVGGQVVQIAGTFAKPGVSRPTILARDIRLRTAGSAATVPPLGGLVALGLREVGSTCTYRALEAPIRVISGAVRTSLTRPDGSGFSLDLFPDRDSTLVTLHSNPSGLCLAFDVPPGPVPRLVLELAGRRFEVSPPQSVGVPAQSAPAPAAPAPAAPAPPAPKPAATAPAAAPVPAAEDASGSELVCRRGNETLRLQVPSGRLAQVREIAARMGFSASDCTFRSTR